MPTSVGDFVKISGLTSDGGRRMNGNIGIARTILSERGRVGVEVLGEKVGKPGPYTKVVSIKESNLGNFPSEDGYKLLGVYLINKMYDAKDTKVQLEALQERFEIPGFSATWRDNATMVSMLRLNDRVKESLAYSEKCLEQVPRAEPQRNNLLYDYGQCLLQDGQLKAALNATLEINQSEAYHKQIKLELLGNISAECGTVHDDIKEPALRALMEIVPENRKGKVAWDLGAALCRHGSYEEGIPFYEQAVASGINKIMLNQALSIARMQARSKNAGGGLVPGTLPDGSTVMFKQL